MSRSFGEQLRAAREAAGLSRQQLALLANVPSTNDVARYERDEVEPSPERKQRLLAACKPRQAGLAATVTDVIDQYEADIAARTARLRGDIQAAIAARDATPVAEQAVTLARPARRRAAK